METLSIKSFIKAALVAVAVLGMGLLSSVVVPEMALADARTDACQAIGGSGGAGNCSTGSGPTVASTIRSVINVLSAIIGAVAVIMIVLGGFRFITSAGDANKTKGARDTILYAVIGLVVVGIAQAIVQFVLEKV